MHHSTIRATKWLQPLPVFLILLAWKGGSLYLSSELLLPPPEAALLRLIDLIGTELFWFTVAATLRRTLLGFAFSLLLGVTTGTLAGASVAMDYLTRPVVLLTRATPLMSVILLALIWFRSDNVPVFVSFLVCYPVIHANAAQGVKSLDDGLLEMSKVFRVKWWRRLLHLYLPSIVPFILAGTSAALGLGLKVVVAAEALSQPKMAIGSRMQMERLFLETAGVFAWTIAALLLSWVLEFTVGIIEESALSWRRA